MIIRRSPRTYPVKISPRACLDCGRQIIGRSSLAKFCSGFCAESFHTKAASAKRAAARSTRYQLAVK